MPPQNPNLEPQTPPTEAPTPTQPIATPQIAQPASVTPAPQIVSVNSQHTPTKTPALAAALISVVVLGIILTGVTFFIFKNDSENAKEASKTPAATIAPEEKTAKTETKPPQQAAYTPYPPDVRQKFTASCISSYDEADCTCMLKYFEETSVPIETALNFADTSAIIQEETLAALARAARVCNL